MGVSLSAQVMHCHRQPVLVAFVHDSFHDHCLLVVDSCGVALKVKGCSMEKLMELEISNPGN